MKIKTSIVTIALVGSLGFGVTSSPVSAASWHKGTPKSLRGTYRYKKYSPNQGFGDVVKIFSNKIEINQSNNPLWKITNVHYKKIGKYYRITGHRQHIGFILSGTDNLIMYRKGKYFKYTGYPYFLHHGFRSIQAGKKVSNASY